MLLSEKVTLIMILLTITFLIFFGDSGLEVFLVLILIGVLILRELIETFTPSNLKDRINSIDLRNIGKYLIKGLGAIGIIFSPIYNMVIAQDNPLIHNLNLLGENIESFEYDSTVTNK
ncbi:MAG: hypothetical protein ACFFDN_28870 [Candidatus Hodarchaeota archaeon]